MGTGGEIALGRRTAPPVTRRRGKETKMELQEGSERLVAES